LHSAKHLDLKMRRIRLIVFASILHDESSVMNSRADLFAAIRKFTELEIAYPSVPGTFEDSEGCVSVCFIATGGTEEIFRRSVSKLPRPIYLLSDGFHNSLAASFEISTYLNNKGIESTMLNVPIDNNPEFYSQMDSILFPSGDEPTASNEPVKEQKPAERPLTEVPKNVLHYFAKSKIGLVGGASPWLISSAVDTAGIESKYGCKFIKIGIQELISLFRLIDDNTVEVTDVVAESEKYLTGDRTKADLIEAAKMYVAIKRLCAQYELNAVTVKCFDLINTCRTTSCLALSLLNDEGIVAACEGDIQSLWSMMYVKGLTSKVSFMVNPASTNREELTVDFAHCSVPLSFVHGYRLPSHFESSTGIGLAGSVPCGRYNILKIAGEKLDIIYSASGSIIMNTNVPQRCRTQIRFKFDSAADFDGFITKRTGNHIIIYKED